jgi:hypothetical protein
MYRLPIGGGGGGGGGRRFIILQSIAGTVVLL